MLSFLTGVAVPALAFVLLLLVGLELRIEDFRRITRYPRTVVIATLGQVLLLPLLAFALIRMVSPNETLSVGMMFLALSPGGAISSYYTYLAGRNVALSITLTAISTVFSLISIPISAFIYLGRMGVSGSLLVVPTSTILLQLSLFVLLPIAVGMWLGHFFQSRFERLKPRLRIISLGLVALLLAASISTVRDDLRDSLKDLALLAILFTVGAMLVGALIARLVFVGDRQVVVIECTVRNIPIAILISSKLAANSAMASFVVGYFLIEVLVMIPYALLVRSRIIDHSMWSDVPNSSRRNS